MRFQAAKDKWVEGLFWGISLLLYVMAVAIFFTDLHVGAQVAFAALFAASGIITHSAVIGTEYVIDRGMLRIRSGILIRRSIPLDRIARVKPVESWEASAALSRRRLRLCGRKDREYLDVSPERADEFVRKLKEAAPHVHVESP